MRGQLAGAHDGFDSIVRQDDLMACALEQSRESVCGVDIVIDDQNTVTAPMSARISRVAQTTASFASHPATLASLHIGKAPAGRGAPIWKKPRGHSPFP